MSLFQVIAIDDQWGVFGVNPNNPEDRELATVCENRDYAELRAAALNRVAKIETTTAPNQHHIEAEVIRPRAVRLED